MRFAIGLLTVALVSLLAPPAFAQTYPNRTIKIIVPYPAGGVTDIGARMVGQRLAETLGQPVMIENRVGASGTLGVDAAVKSAPDGYTLLISTGDFITVPALMPKTAYDPYRDLVPVVRIASAPLLLLTHPNSGIAGVKDLVAKAKAAPGRIAFGSPGHGTINQIAVEWLALEAGIKLLHVPYRGGAALVNGLVAGDTALGVTTLTTVKGLVEDGRIKVVAVLSRSRPSLPQAWPTMADSDLHVEAGLNLGVYAPAGTPAAVVARLDAVVQRILRDGVLHNRFHELGMEVTPIGHDALPARIRSEAASYRRIIEQTGMKLN